MAIKACFLEGFQGHGTLGNVILSTLCKAAAGGHRNEIKLDKLAKQLDCSDVALRAELRRLQDSGRIVTNALIDWGEIGSIQLAEPIVACEPLQLSLDDDIDGEDRVPVELLDNMSETSDIYLFAQDRHLWFALRFSDAGVLLVVSEAATARMKKRDEIITKPFANRFDAIDWAKSYVERGLVAEAD